MQRDETAGVTTALEFDQVGFRGSNAWASTPRERRPAARRCPTSATPRALPRSRPSTRPPCPGPSHQHFGIQLRHCAFPASGASSLFCSKSTTFPGTNPDGTSAHAHDDIAIACVVGNGLWQIRHVVQKRLHAARHAQRAGERTPSAATTGASPAAYTSVSSTASALPITFTKSSKQSRAAVAVGLEGQHQARPGRHRARQPAWRPSRPGGGRSRRSR